MRIFYLVISLLVSGSLFADTNVKQAKSNSSSPITTLVVNTAAVRTIFLDIPDNLGNACSVAYDPAFSRYYSAATGSTAKNAYVFGSAGGAPIQTLNPLNIDCRGWVYNANTGQTEIISFNATAGGAGQGIILPGMDGVGNLTGTTSTLLSPVPGLDGSQTSPAYNAAANVLYSRSSGSAVSVVDRTNGALLSTINLDFTTAGIANVPGDGVVYLPNEQLLGVVDTATDEVALFDLSGNYASSLSLDIDVTSASRRIGFTNDQLFVYDPDRDGWQGYTITANTPVLGPAQAIPTVSEIALLSLVILLGFFAFAAIRQRKALS